MASTTVESRITQMLQDLEGELNPTGELPLEIYDTEAFTGEGFEALVATTAGDGAAQNVYFFVDGQREGSDADFLPPGVDSYSTRVVSLMSTDDVVWVVYILYRDSDATCCPTGGGAVVRFQWDDTRITPLDPVPPRRDWPGRLEPGASVGR